MSKFTRKTKVTNGYRGSSNDKGYLANSIALKEQIFSKKICQAKLSHSCPTKNLIL